MAMPIDKLGFGSKSRSSAAALIVCLALNSASAQSASTPAATPPASASTSASTARASSAKPAGGSARAAARERYAAATHKLGASDVETVRAGIAALAEIGGPEAERVLIERVEAGLPPALIDPALTALSTLHSRRAFPVLLELMQHRRSLVRARAISAIAAIETRRGGSTQSALIAALDDPAEEVRSAAATGLGTVGSQAVVPALFTAYDRGLAAALPAIAEIAGRESVDALFARMPQGIVAPVEPLLDRMIERGKLTAPEQVKLARKLGATATDSARQYLLKWLERIKLAGNPAVKKELFQALKVLDSRKHVATSTVAAAPEQPKAAAAPIIATRENKR